jgi:hypothetical protein
MSVTIPPPVSGDGSQPAAATLTPAAFGQFLVAARHRSGLSLEDISATTKVAVRHLEALERGAIDQLPGGLYRRAWIKDYAAAVGLPPDAAVEHFDRMLAPPPASAERDQTMPPHRLESSPRPATLARGAVYRFRILRWVLPAAVVVAAASLVPLLRSAPAPSPDGDSRNSTGGSGVRAATAGGGSHRTDIALPPDEIPAEPNVDPRLVITSRPSGARVTVNGIGWGATPITIRNLPPGPKLIRATKDGYMGRETIVDLGATGSAETVRLILTRAFSRAP